MTLDRRSALGALAAFAAGGAFARKPAPRPLGLADITVRAELRKDYAGTLRKVAAMGYSHFGFRLAPFSEREPPEPPPADKARMVRDAGLAVGAVRYGPSAPFALQAEQAKAIGATILAFTAAPVFTSGKTLGVATRTEFDRWLPELGQLAATARAAGLTFAYHNHWWDHVPLDGAAPLDLIARAYRPDEVAFEVDLAWAFLGGQDPLALVRRLGPRVVSLHLKDVDRTRGTSPSRQLALPGDGELDYAKLLPRLDRVTTALGTVELDTPKDGLSDAARAAAFIRRVRQGG